MQLSRSVDHEKCGTKYKDIVFILYLEIISRKTKIWFWLMQLEVLLLIALSFAMLGNLDEVFESFIP